MDAPLASTVRARDARPLLGLAYDRAAFDCGHFVMLTQRQLFGRELHLAQRHPMGRRSQAAVIDRMARELATPVEVPETGDVALYEQADADGGRHYHLGTVFCELGTLWLLHLPVDGHSLLQREADARVRGLRRVGFYRLVEGS